MIAPKPKINLKSRKQQPDIEALEKFLATPQPASQAQIEAAELFAEPEPARPHEKPSLRLRGCVVCGGKAGQRAHNDHDVCVECVEDVSASATRLEAQRAAVVRQHADTYAECERLWAALSEEERGRWANWIALRDALERTPDEQRRYEATRDAYNAPWSADAAAAYAAGATLAEIAERFGRPVALGMRIPPSLRAYRVADEAAYWASQVAIDEPRRIDVRLAQLAVCLEDLGRKSEADAIYRKEPTQ